MQMSRAWSMRWHYEGLHLAAMEERGLKRLMTHDVRQARAAVEAGLEVVHPGPG